MSLAESDSSIDGVSPRKRAAGKHSQSRHPQPEHPKPEANSVATNVSQVWLDGDVLACACPDCQAPMTIRLWLGLAECRMCGTQVELTEEQEREAQRLWDSRAVPPPPEASTWKVPTANERPAWSQPQHPKPPLPKLTAVPVAEPKPPTAPPIARSEPPRLKAVPVIEPPPVPTLLMRAVPAEEPAFAAAPPQRSWISRSTLQSIISCLISMLVHMAIILVLGLWLIERPQKGPLVLQAEFRMAGRQQQAAEAVVQVKPKQLPQPPIAAEEKAAEVKPASVPKLTEPKLEVASLVKAPTLPEVNYFAAGVVRPGTMFAGRDPRIRNDLIVSEGGSAQTEQAVQRGLKWLAAHQEKEGGWSLGFFHQTGDCNGQCGDPGLDSDVAATALGLLPFLGAGHTQLGGPYRETVQRALDRLVEWQRPDGSFQRIDRGRMYAHGLATIALCEAFALTRDRKLLVPAQSAVQFIVKSQHKAGGWRYTPGMEGDLSVVGWQLMALRSAQSSYLEVPQQTLDAANRFLSTVQTKPTIATFGYMPHYQATPAMTAEGLLSRLYGGTPANDAALLRGADYLLKDHLPTKGDVNLYYWYYGTQAMHHIGGERWARWNERMRNVLLDLQIRDGHAAGSWEPGRHHDPSGGRVYATALAVCTLEVYYRHLPLYRLNSPPEQKEKKPTPVQLR